jgi:hypothetical protein
MVRQGDDVRSVMPEGTLIKNQASEGAGVSIPVISMSTEGVRCPCLAGTHCDGGRDYTHGDPAATWNVGRLKLVNRFATISDINIVKIFAATPCAY